MSISTRLPYIGLLPFTLSSLSYYNRNLDYLHTLHNPELSGYLALSLWLSGSLALWYFILQLLLERVKMTVRLSLYCSVSPVRQTQPFRGMTLPSLPRLRHPLILSVFVYQRISVSAYQRIGVLFVLS